MHSVLALPAILLALTPAAKPLPPPVQKQLKAGGFWRAGCPVPLSGLRLLTVSHAASTGAPTPAADREQACRAAAVRVFRKLYGLRHREGMVTRRAVAAFRSVGWGRGGAWAGDTKDSMHFSASEG